MFKEGQKCPSLCNLFGQCPYNLKTKPMKPYPQFPEDWNDANQTLYRDFRFKSTPDIECLIRLVKEGISDRGNDGVLRARLLGVLNSMFWNANALFWERHYHPKTCRIRLFIKKAKRKYHRFFKTKNFKGNVLLCNLAHEVATEMIQKHKNENNG
jgi:hypothetical protein